MESGEKCIRIKKDESVKKTNRHIPLKVIALAALIAAGFLQAAQAAGAFSVVIVKSRDLNPYNTAAEQIQSKLKEGYPDLDFFIYDFNESGQDEDRFIQMVQSRQASLIVTIGSEAAGFFARHNAGTPVVQSMIYEPVESFAGGTPPENLYGIFLQIPWAKRMTLLRKTLPGLKRISTLCRREDEENQEITAQAALAQLKIHCIEASTPHGFMEGLKKAVSLSDAHLMRLDSGIYNKAVVQEMLLFSARKKYPVIAISSNYVRAGALLSFDASYASNAEASADLALKLLAGEKVASGFRETPELHLSVNRNVAQLFGVQPAENPEFSSIEYL